MTEPTVGSAAGALTVAGLLRARAAERPEQVAFTFLTDGESEGVSLTYGELDRRSAGVAAALAASVPPGERALLLYPPGLDFIVAFFGCLYAGVVAVPAYPPRPNDRSQSRLRAIAHDATPRAALTTAAILAGTVEPRGLLAVAPELGGLRWIATDELSGNDAGPLPEPAPGSIAFLQYTSGSTATPKGVMVTHANLLHNERMIGAAFDMDESSVVVGWLPLYHDMGLIGNVLQPLHAGGRCVLMSPVAFLQRPMRWLEAISRYRGTVSGGPNFAYELCLRKAAPEALAGLDLSSWKVAFNGAEPVRASTLERFAEAFAACGFRREAFYPCYGLAEATLFVTGGHGSRVERERVSCGRIWMGQRVVTVGPETGEERPAGEEGEIWISGPSVARGYWENEEATARDFHAFLPTGEGPFLRTGDLGFLSGGELYVTGRLKDLIILRGRNHYPQDVELTAERSHPDLQPGGGAAFSVEIAGEERLVVVHEVARHRRGGVEEIAEAVRRAVAAEHEVQVHEVMLIRQAGLPKTSSGKVQRRLCRELYLRDELPVVGRSALAAADPAPEIAAALTRESLAALNAEERRAMLAAYLRERASAVTGAPVALDQPLTGLGLDSLSAVELKGSVEGALGLAVPLADLLQGISVAELADLLLAGLGIEPAVELPPLRAHRAEGDGPLSAGQRGLWFIHRLAPEGGAFNIAVAARVRGLDPAALTRALSALAQRHEALRTVFPVVGDEPVQRVLAELPPDVRVEEDLGRLSAEAWRPFDLETGPLLRARIFTGPEETVLLLVVHHIVADFTSLAVMGRDLAALYRGETLEPPALRYADYVRWQAELLAGPRGERLWSWWRERLEGVRDLDLAADHPRPPVQTWRGDARAIALPPELVASLGTLASGSTLFMVLLAAFQAQLGRYTGQEDFAVGAALAGRPLPELAGLVGYFVNLLPLRTDLSGSPGFGELLVRARRTALEGMEHGDFPFSLIAERLRPVRDPARPPLFQTMLVFQRARPEDPEGLAAFSLGEEGARLELGGLSLESARLPERRSQLDFSIYAAEDGRGGVLLSLEFNADLFDGGTAERMLGHLRTLLEGAAAAPETPVWHLPLLTDLERGQFFQTWDDTVRDYPRDLLLHQLFETQAARTPDAEAVVSGEARLTYAELNARANRLAHRLRRLGVGPEDRVGVCLRRSERMIVSLFAILKAGGAYVPLDPAYPRERLKGILEDSAARMVIGEEATAPRLAEESGGRWLSVDTDLSGESDENPVPLTTTSNLAYLIYTSGSTGKPKAVAIEHRSPVVLMHWSREAFPPEELAGTLAATSIGFDVSVFEIFAPLSWGGRIFVVENLLSLPGMAEASEVRLVAGAPSVVAELARAGKFPSWVRTVNLGGEAVPPALVKGLAQVSPELRIVNAYGPSEDTTYTSIADLKAGEPVSIGRPVANTRIYLLDAHGEPVPAGVPGELYIAGAGLARGYLGRPGLTAEKYVPNPFSEEPGARLYRVGDLARRRPDGLLDYLGRIDHQVKIRGFRVELGEIEAALARHPRVREAVAVARDDRDGGDRGQRLVAYVTPRGTAAAELRSFLRESLPDYMVPAAFVSLDALPLSPNGKVDRRALPDPGAAVAIQAPAAPVFRGQAAELLAGLMAEVLGVEQVGPDDDFFAVGGHSLLATRLAARASRLLGVELPVAEVFLHPTAASLAARAAELSGRPAPPPVRRVPRRPGEGLPLSFAQRRLWFLDRLEPGSPVYHLPGAIRLAGPLDEIALERALAEIARRHEALRTVLREERGEPVQVVLPPAVEVLPRIDLAGAGQADAEAARLAHEIATAPFDLARGPLFRALLLRRGSEDHELLLTLHHVVADGWSLGILLAELGALYEAFAAGLPSPLPELPVQYADWAVWQRERAGLEEQVAWWRERLAGMAPLALPVDRPRTAVRSSRGGTHSLTLPAAGVEALARRAGATPFMVLLAAFQAQLARYADAESVPVGSPVANRGAAEAGGLIGFFVNMLVLRTPVEGDPAFLELLDRVREVCLGAYAHQDVPFERLVEELRPERRRARNPLFQAVFQLEEPLRVERLGAAAVTVERLETGTAKFDLMLSVVRQPEGLAATLEFDAGLFDPSTAGRLLEHWRRVVEGIAADPDRPLSALLPLSAEEIAQLRSRPSEVEDDGWEEPAVGYVAPRTPEEERLAAIWSEVLGVERVGVHDDFFELGGHSLLAIRVLARIGEAFGTELPLSDLFEASTVAGLARRLAAGAALPEAAGTVPETEPHVSTAEPVFPGTEVEEWLAGIWREVLGVDHVGLHDDFFALGGHSLLAVRVLTRIRDGLGIDLPLTTMFEAPTVAGLAGRLTGGAVEAAPELTEGVERLPLSLAQQRLWLLDRLEPGTPKYNVPMSVRLEGRLALRPLALALAGIVRRHEPLRTVYVQGELGPAQAVLPAVEIPFARVDLSALPAPARERALDAALRAEAVRPFDLARGPVVRFLLAALGPEESVLLASFHHIATDGWSMSIFFRELAVFYGDLLAGRGPSLPEPAVRYADWAVWQRRALEGGALAPQLAWWRRELAGLPVLDLPTDRPRSAGDDRGAMRPVELPGELIQALRGLGRREGATLANVLMAGFAALLARLSGQDDFGVGLPAAGRNRLHAEELIGFFVNTLVARVRAEDDPPFAALLGRLRDAALAAQARQDVPFERLVEELQPERATGVTPLFQVAFNALASPLPAVPMTGLELSLLDVGVGVSKFDLTLSIYEEAGRLRAWAEYRTGLLDPATVERWMGHLRFLLAAAAADPALPLSELPLLSPAERWQLAGEQNDTALALPLDRCLHELFEAQAARTPDAPAVIAEDGELTYRQLDAFAGRLARRLRRLGVGPDTAVGVFAERSAAQVAAVLGVLKAGGAYVPLDPAYPAERLAGMLEDAGAPVLLAPEALLDRLPPHRARVLVLDGEESDAEEAAAPRSGPDNLAAVIFTSGSTGRPKGVMLPHRGLVNRLLWAQEVYRLGPDDAVLLKAALGFDFSLWEMLAPLIAGARLVVARPGGHLDAGYLARAIAERGVTVVHFVPSMLDVFLGEEGATAEGCPSLRQVFSGGEALTPALRERFLARFPGVPLDNQYGPTEISIDTTRWVCAPGQDPRRVPLGRPIANARIHLLDRALRPVPPGAPGVLHVAGPGVARGYFGRPDLTAERFLPDPWGGGGRLYDTGDLARRLPDGNLEFLGRADAQVKVRGVRIEPGEVEAALRRHSGVTAAAVGTDPEGDRLIAWVVLQPEADPAALRDFLRGALPEAMIPSLFIPIAALPLTPSGKLDRRALPQPAPPAPGGAVAAAPASPAEELLAGIWSGLLGVEGVGAHDDFFALGGHSLLATQAVSRAREAFDVELTPADLFLAPTPAALARRIAELRGEERAALPPPVPAPRDPAGDPLSFPQERLWFLQQLAPESSAYNVAGALRLRGPLHPGLLARAFGEIVRRHEALRTVFRETAGGVPAQLVLPPPEVPLPVVDLASEEEAARLLAEEAARPFDLATGPLVRALLVRLGTEEHLLAVTMHHIISDAWSLRVLLRELAVLYRAFGAGEPSPLPALPLQYADFARWQREQLAGERLEAELDHWRRVLDAAPEALDLPADRPMPASPTFAAGRRPAVLGPVLTAELRALARRQGWTPFMVLLAAFDALLARLTGQRDLVVGSAIANRNRLETEGVIGFFTNTLALRLDLAGDPSFRALVRRARAATLEAYAHQDLPFERLVEDLAPHRERGRNPLFQVMLALDDVPSVVSLELPELAIGEVEIPATEAKFDLTLFLTERADGFVGHLEFNRDLFDPATADRLLGNFLTLIAGAVAEPQTRLSRLPLLTAGERAEIIAWSRPPLPAGEPWCVHQRVAARADLHPEALAVIDGEEGLTYGELLRRARRVAAHLRAAGVGPDVAVGIFLGRSLDLAAAILGVLEAGGAYVPLDPGYPRERLRLMLEDARVPVVLTEPALLDALPEGAGRPLLMSEALAGPDPEPWLPAAVDPDNLVYLVYTSGSTGRPKGVAMTHAAISAMLDWQLRTSRVGAGRTLQFAALSFDVSFQEIFSTWCAGGAVVVVDEETRRDPPALLRLLAARRVERLFLPFVALQQLALAARPGGVPASLREVMSAGEQLYVTPQIAALFAALPGSVLYNHYGPSETHAATWLALAGDPASWPERPTVGRPLDRARVFLLDPDLRPVPAGVPGELFVGGAGLARGYIGQPELTAERFVPDPFDEVDGWAPGARLYRTGDLARWLPGGEIEYIGRGDQQVKIRGQRIELAEVETALARHPALRQAAVAVRGSGSGSRRLVGYAVFREGAAAEPAELRAFLAESLPDAMIPSAWMTLDHLPLTPSGKVDRRALPAPEAEGGDDASRAPRDPAEELMAAIWGEVLGIRRLGIHDDFFELGGHSLLATQVMSRVREAFGVEIPLRRLFEGPTVAELAKAVEAALAAGAPAPEGPIPRAPRTPEGSPLPLSFAQERLWFLDRLEPGQTLYNLPLVLRLEGDLDAAALAAAFGGVVARHEALRTVFAERDGEPVQVILPSGPWELPQADLSGLPPEAREREAARLRQSEAARPFDLSRGPLLRTVLLRLSPGRHDLLMTLHHIVSDGWSMGVLVREMGALYAAALDGRPSPLPELAVQYADFALWQRRWLTGEALERHTGYWRERLRGLPADIELPADRPRPAVPSHRGAEHRFALGAGTVAALEALARREGTTPFMVLAASMLALLSRLSGRDDLAIGTPIANRNRAETEGLIGFFVNTLVLRASTGGTAAFHDLLLQVRETTLGAYAHQDLPFEKLIEELQPERDPARTPFFQVLLALQNAPLPAAELPGLTLAGSEPPSREAKFDLTLALVPAAGGITAAIEYATDLFDPPSMIRFAGQWRELLDAALAAPEAPLESLPLLSAAQGHQIVQEWNDWERQWGDDPALHQLFEGQADLQPEALAVVGPEGSSTFGELEARANRLAHHLRRLGVRRGDPVGLWIERSLDLPAAVLGILKAGALYVPLDAAWPAERVGTILAGTAAPALIAGPSLLPTVEAFREHLPALRHVIAVADAAAAPATRPAPVTDADDTAYLIHTSGSTGAPKGIVVRHRSAVNTLRWNNETMEIGPGDRHLCVNSICFDLSIQDLLGMLGAGATLRIATEEELRDPERLGAILREEGITTWNSAPAALLQLVPFFPPPGEGTALRRVLLAGDWIPLSLPDRIREAFPNAVIGNFGGATETSVWSSWYPVGKVEPAWASIPYGRPLANTRFYVLDGNLEPCPPGVPGDNYIGGGCPALGYAGQPALTAERFLPDPFSPMPGGRMYTTGDRVRFGPGGLMEFLGRVDFQVKVRGYRIELGEIEAALLRHPGVREAVALAREDAGGEKRLVAYVVPAVTPPPATAELREALQRTLPEYMVPWTFVMLDRLPVTANGKLDREALPAPGEAAAGEAYVAPRNELERSIAAVWREVLGLERVGVHDNFFESGGSSLLIVKLHGRLNEALGTEIPIMELFRHSTIDALARKLSEAPPAGETPAPAETPKAEEVRERARSRQDSLRQLRESRAKGAKGRSQK